MGLIDTVFDHNAFHRFESGDIKSRHMRSLAPDDRSEDLESYQVRGTSKRGTVLPKKAQPPMTITEVTKLNLGKIHYHLACLHGADRFPDMAPSTGESIEDRPSHCISSVIFHLCCAASLRDSSACLALARARIGLDSFVYVPFVHRASCLFSFIINCPPSNIIVEQVAPTQIKCTNRY
jgi:elongation factor 2 kinase